ncbi:helix-turn-helix domain-containing protein [Microbispora sp. H10949]|uniref:AraC-like ligand-binding domain-containing protein n=1 Tax=Microbispora sp. H10949 TaxID=2729111 RepID=UPI0016038782|nr:helix-turn-helix domain-containing protein [Microbispora sp. H10949]
MKIAWNTRDMAVPDRFTFWNDTMSRTLVPVRLATDHPARFDGSAQVFGLGALQMSLMNHCLLQASRPVKLIRQSDPEVFQLHLILRGRGRMTQAGRDAAFQAGQLLLIDSSRPFGGWRGSADDPARSLIIQFPRAALGLRSDMVGQLTAAPIPVRNGITGVLAGHLKHLAENADGLTSRDAETVADVTFDLVAAACADRLEATALLSPESRRQALLSLIHDFVRQRLGDPGLTPQTIAAAHQISVRHLYKLFEEQGVTVAAWIRRCRLEQCHRDLADPRQRSRRIQAIATRWGFTDAATFSRAFRSAYGMSPRDHRKLAAGDDPSEDPGVG